MPRLHESGSGTTLATRLPEMFGPLRGMG